MSEADRKRATFMDLELIFVSHRSCAGKKDMVFQLGFCGIMGDKCIIYIARVIA